MRLELSANSKLKQGYTPDWISITYNENGKYHELTMDIQGLTHYDETNLYTSSKGTLTSWAYTIGNDTKFLSDLNESESVKYLNLFNKHLPTALSIIIGLYPVDDEDFDRQDELTDCEGTYDYDAGDKIVSTNFTFTYEFD